MRGSTFSALSASTAIAVSKTCGGAVAYGPQPPLAAWPVRTMLSAVAPQAVGHHVAGQVQGEQQRRGVEHVLDRQPAQPAVGLDDGEVVGLHAGCDQRGAGRPGGENGAVGGRRAEALRLVQRPRPVGGLIGDQQLGGFGSGRCWPPCRGVRRPRARSRTGRGPAACRRSRSAPCSGPTSPASSGSSACRPANRRRRSRVRRPRAARAWRRRCCGTSSRDAPCATSAPRRAGTRRPWRWPATVAAGAAIC